MAYVDVYMMAVPIENKEAYVAKAKEMATIFKRHGALEVSEHWGHDVPDGQMTSMPMAVKAAADEVVAVGWAVWPSKEACEAGKAKSWKDPDMNMEGPMPFDGKRMIFGSFERIVNV